MLDTPDNDAVNAIELPHYDRAQLLVKELHGWAKAGFPGATLADLARIAKNDLPRKQLHAIRKRAEHNCNGILGIRCERRCWLCSQETK